MSKPFGTSEQKKETPINSTVAGGMKFSIDGEEAAAQVSYMLVFRSYAFYGFFSILLAQWSGFGSGFSLALVWFWFSLAWFGFSLVLVWFWFMVLVFWLGVGLQF